MIKLKFKNKSDELEFFKDLHFISENLGFKIRYAEMISDLDVAEKEIEVKDDE